MALQKSTLKRALKKDLKKPSQNVPEDPNVTDSSDLESQLGPRGSVAESLFRSFLDPGGPGDLKWCPKWSPKVPEPPKHRFLTRHGSQMAAQSDVLGLIFQWLWIVGALLSFLFLTCNYGTLPPEKNKGRRHEASAIEIYLLLFFVLLVRECVFCFV